MANKSVYKIIQGPVGTVEKHLSEMAELGWKPILMNTVGTPQMLHVVIIVEAKENE